MTTGEDADTAVSLQVLGGAPTEHELAAVMAVVSEAYAGEVDQAIADDEPTRSAWARSANGMRRMPPRGSVWGRFQG